jgi:hypothetical protein
LIQDFKGYSCGIPITHQLDWGITLGSNFMRGHYTALDFTNNQVLLASTQGSPGIGDDSTTRENGKSFEACVIIFGSVVVGVSLIMWGISLFLRNR